MWREDLEGAAWAGEEAGEEAEALIWGGEEGSGTLEGNDKGGGGLRCVGEICLILIDLVKMLRSLETILTHQMCMFSTLKILRSTSVKFWYL
jgi:hypothetical protein